MNRPRFVDLRLSHFPAAIGLCSTNIAAIAAAANEAQLSLLYDPLTPEEGWYGGTATMAFTVQVSSITGCGFAYVTTPREVGRLTDMAACQRPMAIHNGFFEYLQFGRGLQPKTQNCGGNGCSCGIQAQAYTRDNVVTLSDFTAGLARKVRIFPSESADIGKRVVVRGKDQNGITVLRVDPTTQQPVTGEEVFLDFPFVETVNSYTPPLTGLDKDITLGPVTFFTVNPTDGSQSALSSMEPNEMVSAYRRYLLNGLPRFCCDSAASTNPLPVTITAQARLDFIPVASDDDYLLIQNIPALTEEAQSKRYSRMDTPNSMQLEAKHHARAISLLNGQIDHFEGKTQTAIGVPIFGSDRLRRQPV